MSKIPTNRYTTKSYLREYQHKTYVIKMGHPDKHLALKCLEELFPGFQGDRTEQMNSIHNALYGKSFSKANELGLIQFIEREYSKITNQE